MRKSNFFCFGKPLMFFCLLSAMFLTAGWLDDGFEKRIKIDVDDFRHPVGREVLLTIDTARLEKVLEKKISPSEVKLGFVGADGVEKELPYATGGVDKVDNKMRLGFVRPAGKIYLYYGGRNTSAVLPYIDVLAGKGLAVEKYRSDGFLKAAKTANAMNLRQSKWTSRENSDVYVEQIFALDKKVD